MTRFEVLSQASVLAIDTRASTPLFLTSAHVVQPYLWRNYYPQEWMNFVEQKHTKVTLEIRSPKSASADFHAQFELDCNRIRAHPFRDCAALALTASDEKRYLSGDKKSRLSPVSLSPHSLTPAVRVAAAGHTIVAGEADGDDDASIVGHRAQRFDVFSGCSFVSSSKHQAFLRTPEVLGEGMCGGGLFGEGGDSATCHGIIEGIVPLNSPATHLSGCCAYVQSSELLVWLNLGAPALGK